VIRVIVQEVFTTEKGKMIGNCIHAKIESGTLKDKSNVLIYPHNEKISIKGIEINGESKS